MLDVVANPHREPFGHALRETTPSYGKRTRRERPCPGRVTVPLKKNDDVLVTAKQQTKSVVHVFAAMKRVFWQIYCADSIHVPCAPQPFCLERDPLQIQPYLYGHASNHVYRKVAYDVVVLFQNSFCVAWAYCTRDEFASTKQVCYVGKRQSCTDFIYQSVRQ